MSTYGKPKYQFAYSFNPMLTYIQGSVAIGSTGAVGATTGSGIKSVTRLDAGHYQINFTQPYHRFLSQQCSLLAPNTGSATDPHSESTGAVYVITTVGDTNWASAGLPTGVTAAVGVAFKLTAQPATGTGRVKAVGVTAIGGISIVGDPNKTISNSANPYLILQCVGATDADTTTTIPKDPTDGSTLELAFFMRNSSLAGAGE